jgi:hypothetical protein
MESRQEAILSCLFGVSMRYGKKYCYPSQGKLAALLSEYHGFDISNRTLNRDLLSLVNDRFIVRVRRTRRIQGCGKRFTSTLYKFRVKAYKWVYALGKWGNAVFSSFRLPKMADYKAIRGNEISLKASASRGNPVEYVLDGGPSGILKQTLQGLK